MSCAAGDVGTNTNATHGDHEAVCIVLRRECNANDDRACGTSLIRVGLANVTLCPWRSHEGECNAPAARIRPAGLIMQRRLVLAFVLVLGCSQGVEEGLFGGSITAPATNASSAGDDGSGDDDRSDSSEGSSSGVETSTPNTTTQGDDGPAPGETSDGGADTNPVDPTAESSTDPTIDPSESSGDPTLDPTGMEESSSGGIDPTGMGVGDCCTAQLVPGCGDAALEACVCGLDDYCCSTEWDDLCVQEAGDCGAACAGGGGADCCVAQAGVGCSDATIEACVCGLDDFCCSTQWDDLCASEAIDCGAAC